MKVIQLQQKDIEKFRNRLIKEQKGICPICNNKLKTPCLDHSHKKRVKGTGLCRGVLCLNCNSYVGIVENRCNRYGIDIKDLSNILRRIANYLEKEHLPYIHPSEKPKEPELMKNSYNKMIKLYKEIYPNRKEPIYPKSKKFTKIMENAFNDVGLKPEFYK